MKYVLHFSFSVFFLSFSFMKKEFYNKWKLGSVCSAVNTNLVTALLQTLKPMDFL